MTIALHEAKCQVARARLYAVYLYGKNFIDIFIYYLGIFRRSVRAHSFWWLMVPDEPLKYISCLIALVELSCGWSSWLVLMVGIIIFLQSQKQSVTWMMTPLMITLALLYYCVFHTQIITTIRVIMFLSCEEEYWYEWKLFKLL